MGLLNCFFSLVHISLVHTFSLVHISLVHIFPHPNKGAWVQVNGRMRVHGLGEGAGANGGTGMGIYCVVYICGMGSAPQGTLVHRAFFYLSVWVLVRVMLGLGG